MAGDVLRSPAYPLFLEHARQCFCRSRQHLGFSHTVGVSAAASPSATATSTSPASSSVSPCGSASAHNGVRWRSRHRGLPHPTLVGRAPLMAISSTLSAAVEAFRRAWRRWRRVAREERYRDAPSESTSAAPQQAAGINRAITGNRPHRGPLMRRSALSSRRVGHQQSRRSPTGHSVTSLTWNAQISDRPHPRPAGRRRASGWLCCRLGESVAAGGWQFITSRSAFHTSISRPCSRRGPARPG